jgi:hypothetical protein
MMLRGMTFYFFECDASGGLHIVAKELFQWRNADLRKVVWEREGGSVMAE